MATLTTKNRSLEEMWKEAQLKFEQRVGNNATLPAGNLDDTIHEMEARLERENEIDDSNSTQTQCILDVLTFIKLLGGIASDVASTMFQPATMCFNGLNMLLDIPKKLKKFHEEIESLTEQVCEFMKRFKIYRQIDRESGLGEELRLSIHCLLITFIDMCGLTIELSYQPSRWKRLKSRVKLGLFDDDSGVKQLLGKFKEQVDNTSHISDGIILGCVLRAEKDRSESENRIVEHICGFIEKQGKSMDLFVHRTDVNLEFLAGERRSKKALEEVEAQMNLVEKDLGIDGQEMTERIHNIEKCCQSKLPGTGLWLAKIEQFQTWLSDDAENENKVLLLQGESGSGKSHLLAAILQSFREKSSLVGSRATAETAIAFHAFDSRTAQASKDDTGNKLRSVLTGFKSMLWQLAKQNHDFRKRLRDDSNSLCSNSLEELVTAVLPAMRGLSTVPILLFDGFDDHVASTEWQAMFTLLDNLQKIEIRIVITGDEKGLIERCNPENERKVSFPTIQIGECNGPDVTKYLERSINGMELLKDKSDDTSHLREEIMSNVPKIVAGNFYKVDVRLNEIKTAISRGTASLQEIIDIIDKNILSAQELAEEMIAQLNTNLDSKEIQRLNEMITWAIYGVAVLNDQDLDAALFARFGSKPFLPLKEKIQESYNDIFEKDFDFIKFYPNIEEYLRSLEIPRINQDNQPDKEPTISMKINISNVKVSVVREFFWDLTKLATLNEFKFDESSKAELVQPNTIGVNPIDAKMAIVRQCFKLISDKPRPETERILAWATKWLPTQLTDLRAEDTLKELGPRERGEIFDCLLEVLIEPANLEHLPTNLQVNLIDSCLDMDGNTPTLWEWLCDTSAKPTSRGKWLEWSKRVTMERQSKACILENLALLVSRNWLEDDKWDVGKAFSWLERYLDSLQVTEKADNTEQPTQQSEVGDDSTGKESANQTSTSDALDAQGRVDRVKKWAEETLPNSSNTSLWYERLGFTYLNEGVNSAAKTMFEKGRNLPDCRRSCIIGLAKTYDLESEKEKAFALYQNIVDELKAKKNRTNEDKKHFVDALVHTAKFAAGQTDMRKAIEQLRDAVECDPEELPTYCELLGVYYKSENYSEALALLKDLQSQESEAHKMNRLLALLHHHSESESRGDEFFRILSQLCKDSNLATLVIQNMKQCIEHFSHSNERDSLFLRLHCASIIEQIDTSEKGSADVVKLCEQSLLIAAGYQRASANRFIGWRVVVKATRQMCIHLVSKALHAHESAEDAQRCVDQLDRYLRRPVIPSLSKSEMRCFLGSYYSITSQAAKARDLLKGQLVEALSFFQDEDKGNDSQGLVLLTSPLLHAGDYLHLLSAYSLMQPCDVFDEQQKPDNKSKKDEDDADASIAAEVTSDAVDPLSLKGNQQKKKRRPGTVNYFCDGECGTSWDYADNFWVCKICEDIAFCKDCLEQVKNGTMKVRVCSQEHDFLHVPPWSDEEARTVGKGNVRVGGILEDGKRVGGEIVIMEKWLDMICEDWGLPPLSSIHITEEQAQEQQIQAWSHRFGF